MTGSCDLSTTVMQIFNKTVHYKMFFFFSDIHGHMPFIPGHLRRPGKHACCFGIFLIALREIELDTNFP